jgi:hypothetical protein
MIRLSPPDVEQAHFIPEMLISNGRKLGPNFSSVICTACSYHTGDILRISAQLLLQNSIT